MALPIHSLWRRKLRTFSHRILTWIFRPKVMPIPIDATQIKSILIIRPNYRIGNILFLTPLIRALESRAPKAQIDLLLGAPFCIPMMEPMPNIRHVYALPRTTLSAPLAPLETLRTINQNRYDLIINPVTGSVTANLATLLIDAPYKLGFFSPKHYAPLNRTIFEPKDVVHEALKPLSLLTLLSYENNDALPTILDLALTEEERQIGKARLETLIKPLKEKPKQIIGLFRDARNEKKIHEDWWRACVEALLAQERDLVIIDILAPNQTLPLMADMLALSEKNLRLLASAISALDAFVCGDTGPMHLSSAALTPTIALFNATDPAFYGPLGAHDATIDINAKTPGEVAKTISRLLSEKNRA